MGLRLIIGSLLLFTIVYVSAGGTFLQQKYKSPVLGTPKNIGIICETLYPTSSYCIPSRHGERPQTSDAPKNTNIAHQQLTDNSPVELQELLLQEIASRPNITITQSQVSVKGARAFMLPSHLVKNKTISGGEFAHLHPSHDGSLHTIMPENTKKTLLILGRIEEHPRNPSTVMIYGPRTQKEVEIITEIMKFVYHWVRGEKVFTSY